MVILELVHARRRSVLITSWASLLLSLLVLYGAIRGWMRFTMAESAEDRCAVAQEFLGAVLEFMALLAATFAPDPAKRQMVVDDDLELLRLVRLMQDGFNHGTTFFEVFVRLGRHKHVERLLVPLLLIVNLRPVLSAVASD